MTPAANRRLLAATCTAGTASASAHGHVMMSTEIANVSDGSQPAPANIQPMKVMAPSACTAGA